jgi:hypothetical protein
MDTTYLLPSALLVFFTVFVVFYANYVHTFPKQNIFFKKIDRQNTELTVPHITFTIVVMFL